MREREAKRIKNREWVFIQFDNPDTLPPPFKHIEIETRKGAIYPFHPWYVHGFAVRDTIVGVTMPLLKKTIPFHKVIKWRLTDE